MAGAIVEPEPDACQCGHSHAHAHGGHDAAAADDAPPSRLAQQLWMPWRAIVMNPLLTAAVYTVFNVLFMSIWLLVSLLVWLLTLPGLLLVVVSAILFGLRTVTQYVSYPGQLALVVRDGETNFARLSKRRLTMAIDAAHELAQTLGDTYVAPAGSAAAQQRRMRFLQRHQNHEFSIETLVVPLLRALEQVEKDGNIGMNGARLLSALQDLVTFSTHDLAKHTADLVSASTKEFELRRQQLFLTTSKLATPASTPASTPKTGLSATSSPVSLTPSSSSSQRQQQLQQLVPGRLVVTLEEKLARVRDVLPLIGPSAAVANAKRDFSWILRELCQRKPVDVDIITTLDLIRADLSVRFHGEQVWIPGHNDHQIDSMFVPAAGGFSVEKPVMILCNPNGGLYEFHHFQMDWVKFYTDLECHVLLFNYRGYGRCAGVPSPWAHNLDALAIVDYLKARKGLKKIGVHGESIGGLVATFLARQSDAICVLVADRTFASLPALAQRLVASWAGRAVNWLTWWETDNAGNYLAATCPKLLCSDPNDEIISDGASLKSGVALRVELGDQTYDLPRPVPLNENDLPDEDGSAPSSLSDVMPFLSRCPTLVTGEKRVRRRSEAETRPQPGAPLSDVMVRRFSEASLSLGRRAMRHAEARDTSASRVSSGTHVEISVLDSSSTTVAAPSASFPQELLAAMWMQIASLDGYCGQCFLQAAESGGYDRIRAWTVSMLTWGGQLPPPKRTQLTLEAFDRQGLVIRPLTIFQVHQAFQSAVEQHPGMKFDLDIAVVLEMVEYIMDSLQRRWKLQEETQVAAKSPGLAAVTGTPQALGRLLALHCGHNRQFADNEKAELVDFLRSADFLPATKS